MARNVIVELHPSGPLAAASLRAKGLLSSASLGHAERMTLAAEAIAQRTRETACGALVLWPSG
jgi:hypothetical protein